MAGGDEDVLVGDGLDTVNSDELFGERLLGILLDDFLIVGRVAVKGNRGANDYGNEFHRIILYLG